MLVLAKERISNQVLHFSTGMTSSICENTASHSLEAAIHLEASCNSLTTAVSTKRLAKNLHAWNLLAAGQCETLAWLNLVVSSGEPEGLNHPF